jgi:hypothetical protein
MAKQKVQDQGNADMELFAKPSTLDADNEN